MISDDTLKQIMPTLPDTKRAALLPPLQAAMDEFQVNAPKREAAFLAQVAHESAELNRFSENLNYGAPGLMATWPKRFPDLATATRYERNPEKLANFVYANRIGNGDEASGDGWRFRGRGPIQITGRENYDKYGRRLNVDLVQDPDKAATPEVGFRVAGLYWQENGLNELADAEMFETITKRINGKMIGLDDRLKYYARAKGVLGVPTFRGEVAPETERGVPLRPEFTRGVEALEEEAPVSGQPKAPARKAKRATVKAKKKPAARKPKKEPAARKPKKKPAARKLKKKPAARKLKKKPAARARRAKKPGVGKRRRPGRTKP